MFEGLQELHGQLESHARSLGVGVYPQGLGDNTGNSRIEYCVTDMAGDDEMALTFVFTLISTQRGMRDINTLTASWIKILEGTCWTCDGLFGTFLKESLTIAWVKEDAHYKAVLKMSFYAC